MFQDLHKIRQFLCDASDGGEYLVQKYLERPLLLWGRKFDIRCWALLTDAFDLYVYRDGYLRTSSEPFTLELGDENNMVRGPPHNRVQAPHTTCGTVGLYHYCCWVLLRDRYTLQTTACKSIVRTWVAMRRATR